MKFILKSVTSFMLWHKPASLQQCINSQDGAKMGNWPLSVTKVPIFHKVV